MFIDFFLQSFLEQKAIRCLIQSSFLPFLIHFCNTHYSSHGSQLVSLKKPCPHRSESYLHRQAHGLAQHMMPLARLHYSLVLSANTSAHTCFRLHSAVFAFSSTLSQFYMRTRSRGDCVAAVLDSEQNIQLTLGFDWAKEEPAGPFNDMPCISFLLNININNGEPAHIVYMCLSE